MTDVAHLDNPNETKNVVIVHPAEIKEQESDKVSNEQVNFAKILLIKRKCKLPQFVIKLIFITGLDIHSLKKK